MAKPIDSGNEGGVSWALWAKDGKYGKEFSLSLKNSWKDDKGEWQENPFIPEKAWPAIELIVQGLRVAKFQGKRDKKRANGKNSQHTPAPQEERPTLEESQDEEIPF